MISYSEAFVKPNSRTLELVPPGTHIGLTVPSTLEDVDDQNLRRKLVSISVERAGVYQLELRYNASVKGNAVMIAGANHTTSAAVQLAPASEVAHETVKGNIAGAHGALLRFGRSYGDIRELRLSVRLAANDVLEYGFVGLCELVRFPVEPSDVVVDLRTLSAGEGDFQGRVRSYKLTWKKLLAADLAALVEGYSGIPLGDYSVLYDDTDPLGASYGRFGKLTWESKSFDSYFGVELTFDEVLAP